MGNIKGDSQGLTDTQSDCMITPEHIAKIQKLIPHQFTLDACANVTGDNRLCERYCSHCDSFLKRDLQNEFIWLNPHFQAAQTFFEHYFDQRDAHPTTVGGCTLLPTWSNLIEQPRIKELRKLVHFPKGTRLFTQPCPKGSTRRQPMPGIPWPVNVYYQSPL